MTAPCGQVTTMASTRSHSACIAMRRITTWMMTMTTTTITTTTMILTGAIYAIVRPVTFQKRRRRVFSSVYVIHVLVQIRLLFSIHVPSTRTGFRLHYIPSIRIVYRLQFNSFSISSSSCRDHWTRTNIFVVLSCTQDVDF
jgi:hypothetical protein